MDPHNPVNPIALGVSKILGLILQLVVFLYMLPVKSHYLKGRTHFKGLP